MLPALVRFLVPCRPTHVRTPPPQDPRRGMRKLREKIVGHQRVSSFPESRVEFWRGPEQL